MVLAASFGVRFVEGFGVVRLDLPEKLDEFPLPFLSAAMRVRQSMMKCPFFPQWKQALSLSISCLLSGDRALMSAEFIRVERESTSIALGSRFDRFGEKVWKFLL